MFENMAAFVLAEHLGDRTFIPPLGERGDRRVLHPLAKPIPTKDGYICVSANTDAQAFALFDAIGRPELKRDPRFSSVAARYANVRVYFQIGRMHFANVPARNGWRFWRQLTSRRGACTASRA
jgi:crotonobetainyl-CoA:carnitine CoA-transferase CaiB-like acyl-CoA transferase